MAGRAGQARFGDGQSTLDTRIGQQGEQIVSKLHCSYYESAVRRNMFISTTLARATSLAGTAMIGNIIYNPPDSGVNLVPLWWRSQIIATSATTTAIALAVGYQPTTPTTVTVADASGCTFLQQPTLIAGKAKAYALATVLIAPVNIYILHHNTAAIAATGVDEVSGEIDGALIVPPGHFLAFTAIGGAVAASGHNSMLLWEEVPVV